MRPRKARPLEELLQDQGIAYHIGQLIGAVEMAAWQLSQTEDAKMKSMGEKLAEVSGWFFVRESE
jgi:hypothetical protein